MNEKKLNICIYANCQSWGLRYFINKYIPNWNVYIMLNYQYSY